MRKKALELDRFNTSLLEQAHALNAKELLYQAIVEDQADLISLALPNGELTFVNEAYAAHFGKQAKDMIGHNLMDYVAEQDKEAVRLHIEAVCKTPGIAAGENQMRSLGGVPRWIAWSNRSLADEQGKVIGLHSVGRDITNRKQMELALRDSHERYRSLYESTPAMMHSIDAEGKLLFVSDSGSILWAIAGRTSLADRLPTSLRRNPVPMHRRRFFPHFSKQDVVTMFLTNWFTKAEN